MPAVSPSIDWAIAFRSSGFVTCRMSWVLHWERTLLSIRAARCVTAQRPRPNLRPSLAMFLRILEQVALPCWGAKLWASSTTRNSGGILPFFRLSKSVEASRATTSS